MILQVELQLLSWFNFYITKKSSIFSLKKSIRLSLPMMTRLLLQELKNSLVSDLYSSMSLEISRLLKHVDLNAVINEGMRVMPVVSTGM